jgi:long-chain acyl-CoA synthetase
MARSVYWRDRDRTEAVMNRIVERFNRLLRDQPGRPLLHLPVARLSLTANDLSEAAVVQRSVLESCGVRAGHLVIYAGGNRPDCLALWLACGSLDAVLMPVDAGAAPEEIAALAERFAARAAIVMESAAGRYGPRDVRPYTRGLSILTADTPAAYAGATALRLTSGSTGLPKAAFTTDEQLLNDAEHIATAMDIRASDCQLAAIPLSHAYGIGNLLLPLLIQGTRMVLREAFVPHQIHEDARNYGVRIFPGVPFMFDHFTAHLSPGEWPSGLDVLVSAGARLERSTAQAFFNAFGRKIHSFYGATETGGIAYDDSHELEDEPTVGRAMPGVNVSLLPEEGAPEGGGRVHVSGTAVASGYAGGEPFDSGGVGTGFLTGDLGRLTDRGHLVLTGRVSSFINVAGRKVHPDEVEAVLRLMPGIADARVVGAPDPARGEQVVACVVANGIHPGALNIRQFCAARLAPHKIPRTVVLLDRVPLNDRGKTDHRRLREAVDAHLRRDSESRVL